MTLRYKILRDMAHQPIHAPQEPGDVGYDLAAAQDYNFDAGPRVLKISTGVAVELPPGMWGLVRLRSGWASKNCAWLCSSGVIDNGYRGEIIIPVTSRQNWFINAGDRIAQLILIPMVVYGLVQADELLGTVRGANGLGSTGGAA